MTRGRQMQRSTSSRRSRSSTFSNPFVGLAQEAVNIVLRNRENEPVTGPFGHPLQYPKRSLSTPSRMVDNKKVKIRRNKILRPRAKYHTTGRLGPVIKKAKAKNQISIKLSNGSITKIEDGFVTPAENYCQYVGHGPATKRVYSSVGRALMKVLWNRAGLNLKNWDELIEGLAPTVHYWIVITYQELDSNTGGLVSQYIDITKTYATIADELVAKIAAIAERVTFADMFLLQGTSSTNSASTDLPRAKVNLDDVHLFFEFYSTLKIQNRTLGQAVSGVTGDGDADLEDNIANNPLVGKCYTSDKKWQNGFTINQLPQASTIDLKQLSADNLTGIIQFPSTIFDGTPALQNYCRKPPPPFVFGVAKASTVVIRPGEIRPSKISFKCTMKFNTFFMKYIYESLRTITTGPFNSKDFLFGHAEMIGIEKYLESRVESAPISLACQIDQTYICYAKTKADYRSIPRVEVANPTV